MREYAAYLFDADGTIIDTKEMIVQSFWDMEDTMGVPRHDHDYLVELIGLPALEQMHILLGPGLPEEQYARANAVYGEHNDKRWKENVPVFPGAAEVLSRLHDAGKPLALVTSRYRSSLEPIFERLGLLRFFSAAATPDDTALHKPHPDPALLAARLLGVRPQDALLIGDAEFDIVCGHDAGMDTALVAWGNDPTGWKVQPTYILKSFSDMLAKGSNADH